MLTTQDGISITEIVRPAMTVEEQLRELRGVVKIIASIAGPTVVQDIVREYPAFFMREQ